MVDVRLESDRDSNVLSERRRARAAELLPIVLLIFAGYYVGARLGLALTFLPNPISVLWPPNAILFAAMLLVPVNRWWIVIAAALPAHLLAELEGGVPVSMVLCWFVSNVTEAVVGAACARWLAHGPLTFDRLLNVIGFIGAVVVATFVSSFLDSAFVALNGWGQGAYWQVWTTRFFSNVTASLIIVPLVVTWASGRVASLRVTDQRRTLELAVLAAGLCATTLIVFDTRLAGASPSLLYLPLPLLLWAALRFGPTGASTALAIVALTVIWGAGHGLGPLGSDAAAGDARSVQLFLMFIAPTVLCLAAAVEEQLRASDSLRLGDQRFRLVLEATRDTVYDREIASDHLWWSGDRLLQFGYGEAESPRGFAALTQMLHPEDRQRVQDQHAVALAQGDSLWQTEFRLRQANGVYVHIHEQGFIDRDARGRPTRMIGALTDITERRDLEELSQRLAQASRLTAMGELSASIAHEINQPMSAILSNVDAAEMLLDAGDFESEELRQILRDIRNDDLRASEVIKHIRGLANKRATEIQPFRIDDVVSAVLRLVRPIAQRRHVRFATHFAAQPQVRGDRIYVQQVLLNLVLNGIDAMAGTPEDARLLVVETSAGTAGYVEIAVRDRGHGIAADAVDRIFESFYTTKKEGMGLGLSIARSLVEAQGGVLWAENNPEQGATFRFTLLQGSLPQARATRTTPP